MSKDNLYESVRKNNVNVKKEVASSRRMGIVVGSSFVAGVLATMCVLGTTNMIERKYTEVINRNEVKEELTEYKQAVNDSIRRVNFNENFYYDDVDIANSISKSEDFEKAVYGVYLNTGLGVMDNVFYNLNNMGVTDYKRFSDYLRHNGYVNDEGQIDYKAYEKNMDNRLLSYKEYEGTFRRQ